MIARLDSARTFAHTQGWDQRATRAWTDRALYHPDNPRDYGATVGWPVTDRLGRVSGAVCVGCWWCGGPRTAAHDYLAGGVAA